MAFALAPEISGTGLVAHDTIGSTSLDAMERLRAGAAAPLWVVSGHQTAGRGRRGSAWATPPGNLAASVGLRLDLPAASVATLGFAAGLAIVRALDAVSSSAGPSVRFALKWPNDVLVDGAKLVGILLETEETPQGRAVVVGIGINVLHAPDGVAYPVTSLAALGIETDAETVFEALGGAWATVFAAWDAGRGFADIRRDWLARAHGLGGPVGIRTGTTSVEGRFETIDPQGQMVVRRSDGSARVVSAGDVHFGNAASLRAEAVA